MMKGIKRLLAIVITIILTLILIFNVYNMICVRVLGKDLATINGYGVLEVVSGSMEPTIHVGDMIIIDTKDKEYNEQEIVTFYDKQGSFVTHRIISLDGDVMITKGDNNDSEDGEVQTSKIVGTYVTKLNGVGKILSAFKSPLTMVMILIIGILTCVFVSTDKDGNPVMSEEEKELEEFREYKKKQVEKEAMPKKAAASKTSTKKKSTTTKSSSKTKSTTSKKKNTTKKK